ncbi:SPL family radical SAM protein [Paenibacillus hamazuiensis]|uniref:SPL family radical SAM protein n=1 Tax=Paenibacillus hamazuiensis TaxID=2936508 RepID=UPI00200E4935|nr:radical SAM protein [Paenibacillus hamazuiensis]
MAVLSYTEPKRLLNPAGGYLTGYSHTLNPYAGCAFACAYCYVREMPIGKFRREPWGAWVDVKRGAAELLRKELRREGRKGPLTIFMSSSTDPYQPAEYKEQVTRTLLEVMADEPPAFLFVQTRSPLVTRDIDLLQRLEGRVRVSMTVETDLESVRRVFAPAAPPIAARLRALRQLAAAGIDVQAAVSPLLPCTAGFAELLAGIVPRVCIDDYFRGDGSLGKRTGRLGLAALYERLGQADWYGPDAFDRVVEQFRLHFPEERIGLSQEGFMP